jgi:hypothetical protein
MAAGCRGHGQNRRWQSTGSSRLKTLKRAMCGSAGVELLGARMLPIHPAEQHAD